MDILVKDKLFRVLLILLALTLASCLLLSLFNLAHAKLGVLLIVIAFVKVRLIVVHFMEAHTAYPIVRMAFEAWVFVVAAIVIALYLR